jgi:hypothetical protein
MACHSRRCFRPNVARLRSVTLYCMRDLKIPSCEYSRRLFEDQMHGQPRACGIPGIQPTSWLMRRFREMADGYCLFGRQAGMNGRTRKVRTTEPSLSRACTRQQTDPWPNGWVTGGKSKAGYRPGVLLLQRRAAPISASSARFSNRITGRAPSVTTLTAALPRGTQPIQGG